MQLPHPGKPGIMVSSDKRHTNYCPVTNSNRNGLFMSTRHEEKIVLDTLGDRLRFVRRSLNISQESLAARFGVTKQTIIRYEKNTRKPNDNFLKLFADAYKVDDVWLLTGKGDKYGERAIPSHFFSRAKYDRWLMFRFIREFHANLHILEGLDSNTIANIFTNLYEQYAIEQEDIREETKNNSYINWKSSSQIEEDMKFYRKIYKK